MELKESTVLTDTCTWLQQTFFLKGMQKYPNKEKRTKNKNNQITEKTSKKTTKKQLW